MIVLDGVRVVWEWLRTHQGRRGNCGPVSSEPINENLVPERIRSMRIRSGLSFT